MTAGETEISHKTTKKFHGWSSGRWKCLLSADSINMNQPREREITPDHGSACNKAFSLRSETVCRHWVFVFSVMLVPGIKLKFSGLAPSTHVQQLHSEFLFIS